MASVHIHRSEAKGGHLPLVCAKCGDPAETTVRKKFSWAPSWVLFLLLVGLLPWLIATMIATKRMTVEVPLCERHKNHWSWRSWTVLLTLFGGVILCIAVPVSIDALSPKVKDDTLLTMQWAIPVAIGFTWLIAAALISTSAIQAGEITEAEIKLTNVCAAFRDAVNAPLPAEREHPELLRRWNSRDKDDGNRQDPRITPS